MLFFSACCDKKTWTKKMNLGKFISHNIKSVKWKTVFEENDQKKNLEKFQKFFSNFFFRNILNFQVFDSKKCARNPKTIFVWIKLSFQL